MRNILAVCQANLSRMKKQPIGRTGHDQEVIDLANKNFDRAEQFATQHELYDSDNTWSYQALLFAGLLKFSGLANDEVHRAMSRSCFMSMMNAGMSVNRVVKSVSEGGMTEKESEEVLYSFYMPNLEKYTAICFFHGVQAGLEDQKQQAFLDKVTATSQLFGGTKRLSELVAT